MTSIDDLGPLPDKKITSAKHNGGSLLLLALHRHETHGRSLCGLADRFRIGRIVLLPFDERLHVVRRDEPDLVSQLGDLAVFLPVTRCGLTRRLFGKTASTTMDAKACSDAGRGR